MWHVDTTSLRSTSSIHITQNRFFELAIGSRRRTLAHGSLGWLPLAFSLAMVDGGRTYGMDKARPGPTHCARFCNHRAYHHIHIDIDFQCPKSEGDLWRQSPFSPAKALVRVFVESRRNDLRARLRVRNDFLAGSRFPSISTWCRYEYTSIMLRCCGNQTQRLFFRSQSMTASLSLPSATVH